MNPRSITVEYPEASLLDGVYAERVASMTVLSFCGQGPRFLDG
jgi:hypothetical protein